MSEWKLDLTTIASTGTRYYEATREVGDDLESLKIRISDHGTAHCSEDLSLARRPGGDDHTREQVAARLARRAD